jgi:hypothetical protein
MAASSTGWVWSCLVLGCNVSDSQALSISQSYYDKNCIYNLEYLNDAGPGNSLTTGTGSGANTQQSNNGAGAFKEALYVVAAVVTTLTGILAALCCFKGRVKSPFTLFMTQG